jgi:hypothetical protein
MTEFSHETIKKALILTRDVADEIWAEWCEGTTNMATCLIYQKEKRERNWIFNPRGVSGNFVFYLGQFDPPSQMKFIDKVTAMEPSETVSCLELMIKDYYGIPAKDNA